MFLKSMDGGIPAENVGALSFFGVGCRDGGGSIRTGEIRRVDWSRAPAKEATVDGYLFIEDMV